MRMNDVNIAYEMDLQISYTDCIFPIHRTGTRIFLRVSVLLRKRSSFFDQKTKIHVQGKSRGLWRALTDIEPRPRATLSAKEINVFPIHSERKSHYG